MVEMESNHRIGRRIVRLTAYGLNHLFILSSLVTSNDSLSDVSLSGTV